MCPRSPSQRVEELGFNPAALDPVPTAPSAGPGWLGQPTCRTLPSDLLAEPPPPHRNGLS